jgi:hypothetical protein
MAPARPLSKQPCYGDTVGDVKRRNGFQRPYSDLQIITWILYPVMLVGFYALVLPMLAGDRIFMAVAGGLYFVLHCWSARAAYRTTVSDPADPDLKASPKYRELTAYATTQDMVAQAPLPPLHETCFEPNSGDGPNSATGADKNGDDEWHCKSSCSIIKAAVRYVLSCCSADAQPAAEDIATSGGATSGQAKKELCYWCQVRVPEVSRHCKFCDKCVHRFDHHCRWLNNCIGSTNYRDFIAVLMATFLFTSLQLVLSVLLIVRYFKTDYFPGFKHSVGEIYGPIFAHEGYPISLIFYCVLLLPVVCLIAQLLQFHLVLLSRQQTTFEFVSEASRSTARSKRRAANSSGGKAGRGGGSSGASRKSSAKRSAAAGGGGARKTSEVRGAGAASPMPVSTPTHHGTTAQIEVSSIVDRGVVVARTLFLFFSFL